MDFHLDAAQQALKARARRLADGVFRERAARSFKGEIIVGKDLLRMATTRRD